MTKKIFIEKLSISFIGAWFGDKLEIVCPSLLLLCVLMLLDYVSGMLASKKEAVENPKNKEYGWSSKKSIIGIYKKVGYIITVIVAVSVDYLIFRYASEMDISFKSKTIFGLLVTIWLIINELVSILENAGRMGVELPVFLSKILVQLKKGIGDKE